MNEVAMSRIDEIEFRAHREDLAIKAGYSTMVGLSASRRLSEDRAFLLSAIRALQEEDEGLREALNTPEIEDFSRGVVSEAQHQRERWGDNHDRGKSPLDWFWLIGYLAQKACFAQQGGNQEKALHHTISTAAALANWHAAIRGDDNQMVPGAPIPVEAEAELKAKKQSHAEG